MSSTRTGLGWLLTRALVLPMAALVGAAAYLVCSGAFADGPGGSPEARTTTHVESPWKASYSRRFPGCVAVVLWPDEERPDAVVVRLPGGEVVRISRQAASHGALQHDRYEDARIIGACYAR